MLDDLNELRTFQRILARGSLSAAARDLGVGLAVVSKRLASLERRVGQRLIHRTTRRLTATHEGLALVPHVERVLEALAAAEVQLESGRDEPRGLLRITAPISLGRTHLVPLAARLVERHPHLDVELRLDDRVVDLAGAGIDVAIRIGKPQDGVGILRKLADNRRILVAAPSYLDRHGRPRTVHDLASHACLLYDDARAWHLEGPGGEKVEVPVRARLRANSGDAVSDWALAGMGIMLKSMVDASAFVVSGQLERVLGPWQSAPAAIYALIPSGRHLPRKTRVFLDAVSEHLAACEQAAQKKRRRARAAR